MRPQSQTCNEALDGHIELDAPRPVLHALGKHQLRQLKLRLALTVGSQRCEPFLAGHDLVSRRCRICPCCSLSRIQHLCTRSASLTFTSRPPTYFSYQNLHSCRWAARACTAPQPQQSE